MRLYKSNDFIYGKLEGELHIRVFRFNQLTLTVHSKLSENIDDTIVRISVLSDVAKKLSKIEGITEMFSGVGLDEEHIIVNDVRVPIKIRSSEVFINI